MSGEFYVYALENPITGLPFYVGKGKGNRAYHHSVEIYRKPTHNQNNHKLNTIRKIIEAGYEVAVKFIDTNLTEEIAFELEMFMIDMLGRKDTKTGILTNLTDGGEGLSGLTRDLSGENNPSYGKRGELSPLFGRKHTAESLLKMSLSQKGKVISEEHKQAMRKPKSEAGRLAIAKARLDSSYRPTEEVRQKISASLKGRPSPHKGKQQSIESNKKRSEVTKGVAKPRIECPHCKMMIAKNVADRFHFDNCKDHPEPIVRVKSIISCPNCNKEGSGLTMKRYHFDNCKFKKDNV
jgi:hypothetical protein